MLKKLKRCMVLLLCLLPAPLMAWSAVGHKLVAHIAYDHLTPQAKIAVDRLTEEKAKFYPARSRFVYISTWADWSRDRGDSRFRLWHYIDLPLAAPGIKSKPPNPINAVYGINHCKVVLNNPKSSVDEQQTCLKLLVHVVGDIHQPLHTVNRFSKEHPRGDHGGNSHKIKSSIADNMHAYWDRGLGKFKPYQRRSKTTGLGIRQYAEEIQERYPLEHYTKLSAPLIQSSVVSGVHKQDKLSQPVIEWAREGRSLSASFIYQAPENASPSKIYRAKGILLMEERLALAGYRLAMILNTIYNKNTSVATIG